ncbi:hypothetical protein DFJ67_6306 [Asanoa ferruginea]|uniref:Uncharacterized protein n=1 Tax=Asanoa ferruginea TaxID=53367 RepID=A0A3D9ZUF6_9ACTN|nr:hypothetical protein [Asanoa ferruginea]REG00255.1 hypothetical protein DFJ67_6306 [Asanoa ferruginea]GIF46046.1 hypothetical protein Afe04nite_05850 [Asanoa ferruginea]
MRSMVIRRLLRAGAIAIAVVAVTVLFFAPSADGHPRVAVRPDSDLWEHVPMVALTALAVIVTSGAVVLLRRRRY